MKLKSKIETYVFYNYNYKIELEKFTILETDKHYIYINFINVSNVDIILFKYSLKENGKFYKSYSLNNKFLEQEKEKEILEFFEKFIVDNKLVTKEPINTENKYCTFEYQWYGIY